MISAKKIITIDGPAGAGKSTLARRLAEKLNWTYLDTGAMYRAVGLSASEKGVDVNDEDGLSEVLRALELRVAPGEDTTRVFLGEREVTDEIRQPHVSALASAVSARKVVREAMLSIQRGIGLQGEVVAEGRDMGTVVFPEAEFKFFLDASLEERSRRRFEELLAMGKNVNQDEVREDMRSRDQADSTRALAPLKPASDAVVLDTTLLGVEQVLSVMLSLIQEKLDQDNNKYKG